MQKNQTKKIWITVPLFVFTILLPSYVASDSQTGSEFILLKKPASEPIISTRAFVGPIQPPSLSARAFLVYDPATGQILFSHNKAEQLPIASLTKLVTALVVMGDSGFTKPILVAGADRTTTRPSLNLQSGDQVLPKDLVGAMLVGSANDAATTLANHFSTAGEFPEKMNALAGGLGMSDSHFSNPAGFDSGGNYSTAEDLMKLVEYARNKLPYEKIWQKRDYSFVSQGGRKYSIRNSSQVGSKNSNIKLIKTGQTPAAKGNLVALFTDGDKNLVSIVLGSEDRDGETAALIDYVALNLFQPGLVAGASR